MDVDEASANDGQGGGYDQNGHDDDASSAAASQLVGGDGGVRGPIRGRGSGGVGGRAPSQEPPSSSAMGQGRGSAEGQDGAKKKCRLCARWLADDGFSPNSPYSREDEMAVDNLGRQATAQGQAAYFKDARQNEDNLKKMVALYRASAIRGPFLLVAVEREVSTESAAAVAVRGRMMWKSEFVKWVQCQHGGCLSEDEATAKWAEYQGDWQLLRDECSPAKAPLRIHVEVPDNLDFIGWALRARRQERKMQKEAKNVDGAIAAGRLATTAVGAGSSASLGNTFAGAGTLLQDIRDTDGEAPLARDSSEADTGANRGRGLSEAEPGKRGMESGDANGDESQSPAKRQNLSVKQSAVSHAKRTADLANVKVREALAGAEKFLRDCLDEVKFQPVDIQSLYVKEVGVAKHRLDFTVAALALRRPVAAEQPVSAANASTEDLHQLLALVACFLLPPPCAEWSDMMTVDALQEETDLAFKGAESDDAGQLEALPPRSLVLPTAALATACRALRHVRHALAWGSQE